MSISHIHKGVDGVVNVARRQIEKKKAPGYAI